ncbi:MAG TPA: PD-(D/E)XK nuclease family protein [Bryobacteraceae bacterium]|nr:PD-(D/E)XK nuclease family protein [Bryobacteraceae bacterium]
MRRLVRAASSASLLEEASRFVNEHSQRGELLIVAPTRGAADDFMRRYCGDAAGVHRFSVTQLVSQFTAAPMAERGLAPLNALGAEALAARAIHKLHKNPDELCYFRPVATSPGFARALARTLRELRLAGIDAAGTAPVAEAGRDLANLHRAYEELLAESRLADFPALLRLAAQALRAGAHRFSGLPLLLLDLPITSTLAAAFIRALVGKASHVLGVLVDGDELTARNLALAEEHLEPADDSSLQRLRTHLFLSTAPKFGAADDTVDLFSAAGESLECTEIARRIHRLAGEGIHFDNIGIVLRSPERYQPLLEEALHRAGIPCYFTRGSVRPDPAGRAFLALLACTLEGFPATRFAEYLSLGQTPPVEQPMVMAAGASGWIGTEDELLSREEYIPDAFDQPEPAPSPATPAAWEKLIVDAAVVGGRERWQRRLGGLQKQFELHMAAAEDEAHRVHTERQLQSLKNLQRLALPIIRQLDSLPKSAPWSQWLAQLSDLAQMTLQRPDSVLLALHELWPMGEVGPVTLEEVSLVLAERLRFLRRPPQKRRYGQVWIGSAEETRGQSFDVVFLPGLAEGIFPKKAFEDPLLLDEYRTQIDTALGLREDTVAEERLRLRAVAAAAGRRLVVSYPRMDVTQNRARVPSFYALEVLRAAEGKLSGLKQFESRAAAGSLTRLGWPAPADAQEAVDALEYDLAVLQDALKLPRGQARGRGRYLFHLNPHLGRSLRARYKRWEKEWSDSDGLLHSAPETHAILKMHRLTERSWSASSLQHFAACPYRFLLHGIHQLRPREVSVPLDEMDPLTRGSLFHAVLFELSQRAHTSDEFMTLADAVLDEVAARYEEDLAPAISRVWRTEVEDLRADLKGWLRRRNFDSSGWDFLHSEYAFGMSAQPGRDPASTPEPARVLDGILLRGSIDWIERRRDGEGLRITDHKTGRTPKEIPHHVRGGTVLQPLLYALAAEAKLGLPVKSTRLYYCTQRGGYTPVNVSVEGPARRDLQRALQIVDEAIGSGWLPVAPDRDQCVYCDYQIVCGPREEERSRRKIPDERLIQLRSIP